MNPRRNPSTPHPLASGWSRQPCRAAGHYWVRSPRKGGGWNPPQVVEVDAMARYDNGDGMVDVRNLEGWQWWPVRIQRPGETT